MKKKRKKKLKRKKPKTTNRHCTKKTRECSGAGLPLHRVATRSADGACIAREKIIMAARRCTCPRSPDALSGRRAAKCIGLLRFRSRRPRLLRSRVKHMGKRARAPKVHSRYANAAVLCLSHAESSGRRKCYRNEKYLCNFHL